MYTDVARLRKANPKLSKGVPEKENPLNSLSLTEFLF